MILPFLSIFLQNSIVFTIKSSSKKLGNCLVFYEFELLYQM
jgi:hypothetical protein